MRQIRVSPAVLLKSKTAGRNGAKPGQLVSEDRFVCFLFLYIIGLSYIDGVSPSMFRCTSTPIEVCPVPYALYKKLNCLKF